MKETTMHNDVRLAVVMDPIDRIKYAKDTTLALLLAAQARGWSLSYLEQRDLRLRDGVFVPIRRTGSRSVRQRWNP
jgi:glutathione synthase